MPLFMDFHKIDSDAITEDDMYKAHLRDVAVQNKHGLIYKKYYLNLPNKTAFCLIESPDRESCVESHKEAHGLGACNVIEVSREHEFLPYMGEGGQNEQDLALTLTGEIDSGFRTILLVDFLDLMENQKMIGSKIIDFIKNCNGSVIKVPSEKYMASFIDAIDALDCAQQISRHFESSDQNSLYSIALATGRPVDEQGENLFEETKSRVNVMSRLGFQKGIFMDLETKLSASHSKEFSKIDTEPVTILDVASYKEIEKLDEVLQKNLINSAFKSDDLSNELGLSKTQAYRKISALVGIPPNKLLSELRLIHAAKALKTGNKTVSEVAYDSGFNSPTYFTRVFRKRYNILPTVIGKSISR
ncbi:helix-turn-helix transcriptional regulator [Maribacter sp. LLG6340-A2]|uniref:AraC family transcriptional regulator n=1 Tax=Maribacter sp. LLG6340-A2 TaxID=3160834 RepID=UPI00386A0B83